MNNTTNLVRNDLTIYNRDYSNDVCQDVEELRKGHSPADILKRAVISSAPFLTLYKPLSLPASLALNGLRVVTNVSSLIFEISEGNSKKIPYQLLQTTIAVIALASTIFAHPLGMLIITSQDLMLEMGRLIEHLREGDTEKALASCGQIIGNVLYLALLTQGGGEIAIAFLSVQVLLGFYHSRADFKNGNYIEAAAGLLMAFFRVNQLGVQAIDFHAKRQIETVKPQKVTPQNISEKQSGVSSFLLKIETNKTDEIRTHFDLGYQETTDVHGIEFTNDSWFFWQFNDLKLDVLQFYKDHMSVNIHSKSRNIDYQTDLFYGMTYYLQNQSNGMTESTWTLLWEWEAKTHTSKSYIVKTL